MVVIHKKKDETAEEKAARKLKEQERAMGIQDEYQAKGFEFVARVQANKGLVWGLVIALIVAAGSWGGYAYYQRRMSEEASAAYIEIIRKLENLSRKNPEDLEKYKESQKELAELAEKYKNSKVTSLADLWAGHLALEARESEASIKYYQDALKKISAKDKLYPIALIGLGYAFESNNQKAEALSQFVAVTELKHNAGKDLAYWEAARLAKESNEIEKAKTYADRLIQEFPNSVYERNAKRLKEVL